MRYSEQTHLVAFWRMKPCDLIFGPLNQSSICSTRVKILAHIQLVSQEIFGTHDQDYRFMSTHRERDTSTYYHFNIQNLETLLASETCCGAEFCKLSMVFNMISI